MYVFQLQHYSFLTAVPPNSQAIKNVEKKDSKTEGTSTNIVRTESSLALSSSVNYNIGDPRPGLVFRIIPDYSHHRTVSSSRLPDVWQTSSSLSRSSSDIRNIGRGHSRTSSLDMRHSRNSSVDLSKSTKIDFSPFFNHGNFSFSLL